MMRAIGMSGTEEEMQDMARHSAAHCTSRVTVTLE